MVDFAKLRSSNMNDGYVSVVKTDCYDYTNHQMIHQMVEQALMLLEMDISHYGTKEWNPLGEIIKPGMQVLIKPNLVMDENHIRENGTDCLYTQPVIVEAVIDYVVKALNGTGKITIGDAPMQECDFENLMARSGYHKICEKYKGLDIECVDFREYRSTTKNGIHFSEINKDVSGTIIDLKEKSAFADNPSDKYKDYRITNYDPRILPMHHNNETNEYYISNHILNADVIINMPKPKSHRKAGVTISLKNFIGANTRKEFLPHHTAGALEAGGDEYAHKNKIHEFMDLLIDKKNIYEAEKKYTKAFFNLVLARLCHQVLKRKQGFQDEGSWYGNDTISRTISDINRVVRYADKNGILQETPCRNVFIIADMIIAGEKEGPVCPSPKRTGIIAAGRNTVCFDEVLCTIMGFDYKKIPTIVRARNSKSPYKLVDAGMEPWVVSNIDQFNAKAIHDINKEDLLYFEPTSGWKRHIEINN